MSRVFTGFAMAAMAMGAIGQASAADWPTGPDTFFRPAYPADMAPMEDSLDFEAGLRYFYGVGGQRTSIGPLDYSADDGSHFVELHGRIDDHSTSTYVQGNIGYAAIIDGDYETPTSGGPQSTDSGTIAYGGADFGYLPLKGEGFSAGGFIGYQYLNESLDIGRGEYYTSSGGGDSAANLLEVHGLRLGITGRAEFNDVFDIRVDAAAIPYAALNGTYGAFDIGTTPAGGQGSAADITGHLWGGALEAMVGFKPHENFAIRGGLRGYYLTGPTETYFETRDADGSNAQGYILEGETELFRWGPVIELTGTF
ncbi:hypothetical protein NO932_05845 [Pelagibacterium sp. 26DY04]|uniref:hypothetical protein n=1 Tax=Pelagibacterium sp. 26DY04 TaxID=2967130 RepID=UPI00281551BF|nr:hypothetical protein [Pelagibacterium sp. 26DY04]WMT88130.1 hypothetical protein NO932_05845 [Pelagibacterium sp. 26DY04]